MNSKKQSLLLGGLISSAGILISKFLGLLYVIPFNDILETAANRSYYAQTYNVYSYILNIATAGLPFAIATLVARYASRGDYRTCLLVKKISFYTMTAFGFICMSFMILFSSVIAKAIVPEGGDLTIMRNVTIMISLAVFIIPILSSLRGFYQGLKEMELYSTSQVLEQVSRILFLLAFGAIAVYALKQDSVWALYFGVIAASVAGISTIFYIRVRGRKALEEVKREARDQELTTQAEPNVIFKELLYVSIPFLLTSLFGYCDTIINQFDLKPGLEAFAGSMKYTPALSDAIFYKATKIIAIPMILAPGFSAAIIPFITTAMEKGKLKLLRKYIVDCIESVVYIAVPICLAIALYAQPIIFSLFGGENLQLNSEVLMWFSLEALGATICPIFSSIVMAIDCRKVAIRNTVIFAVVKLSLNRLFIMWFGFPGIILSSLVAHLILGFLGWRVIQKKYHIKWIYTFRKIIIMLLGSLGFYFAYLLFGIFGLTTYCDSRVLTFLSLGLMGIVSCGTYFAITAFCSVPQSIFHFELGSIINKFKSRGKKS